MKSDGRSFTSDDSSLSHRPQTGSAFLGMLSHAPQPQQRLIMAAAVAVHTAVAAAAAIVAEAAAS